MTEQILQEIRDSQIRMERDVHHLAMRVDGHEESLYGDAHSGGVVGGQQRTEARLNILYWLLGISLTASAGGIATVLLAALGS